MWWQLSALLLPIALGPVWAWGLNSSLAIMPRADGLVVVLGGALVIYASERLSDSRRPGHPRARPGMTALLLAAGTIGLVAMLSALLVSGHHRWLPVILIGGIALAYTWLRRQPVAKSLSVGLGWTIAIVMVAGGPQSWHALTQPPAWGLLALIAAGTALCDLKDLPTGDQRGAGRLWLLAYCWLAISMAAGVMAAVPALIITALALAVLRPWPGLHHPLHGSLTVDSALILGGLLALAE